MEHFLGWNIRKKRRDEPLSLERFRDSFDLADQNDWQGFQATRSVTVHSGKKSVQLRNQHATRICPAEWSGGGRLKGRHATHRRPKAVSVHTATRIPKPSGRRCTVPLLRLGLSCWRCRYQLIWASTSLFQTARRLSVRVCHFHRKRRALLVTRCHGLSLSESDRIELNVAICVFDDALAEFRATLVSHMVRIGSNL